MRKKFFLFLIPIFFNLSFINAVEIKDKLIIINSKNATDIDIEKGDIGYEPWYWYFTKIGLPTSISSLNEIKYNITNFNDFDINTSWIAKDNGIGESFSFKIVSKSIIEEFSGKCYVLNGYYKSEELWKEYSRLKKIKLFYNDNPLCFINLLDIKEMQTFDLTQFFNFYRNSRKTNKIKLQEGDVLKFEIIEIYPGLKNKNLVITEFVGSKVGP